MKSKRAWPRQSIFIRDTSSPNSRIKRIKAGLALDSAVIDRYMRHGWVAVRGFFSAAQTADIQRFTEEILALPEISGAQMVYREMSLLDPHTGRPFDWAFIRDEETIEVPTGGPLTFTDPKTMLEECVAGTGIAQVIGWGLKELLASGVLIDLFPDWHGERFPLFAFHPSRKHPPAKVRAFVEFCVEIIQRL